MLFTCPKIYFIQQGGNFYYILLWSFKRKLKIAMPSFIVKEEIADINSLPLIN